MSQPMNQLRLPAWKSKRDFLVGKKNGWFGSHIHLKRLLLLRKKQKKLSGFDYYKKKKIVPFKRLSWFFTSLQTNKVCLNPTNISFWKITSPQAPKISVFLLFIRVEKNKTPKGILSSSSHRVIHPSSTQPIHIIHGTRFRAIFLELGATSHTFSNEGHREGHQPEAKARVFAPILGDGLGMVLRAPNHA